MSAQHIIHMENGRLAADTPFSTVQEIVQAAVEANNIVIHFHGGLVSEASARENASTNLIPRYLQADAYPIVLAWESGLIETLRNNFAELAREALFDYIKDKVEGFVMRKFQQSGGERSAGVLPLATPAATEPEPDDDLTELSGTERAQLEAELETDPQFLMLVSAVSQGLRDPAAVETEERSRSVLPVRASIATLMDPEAVERLVDRPDAASRGLISWSKMAMAIVSVTARIIRRYRKKRDHGFHATVVEEILREFYLANIGGKIWNAMKQDTAQSFGEDASTYGGTALLQELGRHIHAGARPRITLVGHSTGAVYIAYLLQQVDKHFPADFKFNIALLAPASTFELTSTCFIAMQHRIAGLRMFTMTDENEKKDILVPILYPHSLLYFVSGVVEPEADTPVIGMQRFYDRVTYGAGDFADVDRFRQFMHNIVDSCVWSVDSAGGDGLRSGAISHAHFDNDEHTMSSVQHIVRQGYPS